MAATPADHDALWLQHQLIVMLWLQHHMITMVCGMSDSKHLVGSTKLVKYAGAGQTQTCVGIHCLLGLSTETIAYSTRIGMLQHQHKSNLVKHTE